MYPGYFSSSFQATSAATRRIDVHEIQVKKENEVPSSRKRAVLHLQLGGRIAAARKSTVPGDR
jgi:hypothetical protein